MHHYGIRGDTLKWIKDFLDNRKQAKVTNEVNSNCIPVSSGVPQGSVLGPILFLVYINDLPEQVKSRVRLFADDIAMYLAYSSHIEGNVLQNNLLSLEKWELMWDIIPPNARSFMSLASKPPLRPSIFYMIPCWIVFHLRSI